VTARHGNGDPVRCDGCGAPVEQVTDAMRHVMPHALAVDLLGDVGYGYVVCAPMPDGTQPCLRKAVIRDAILLAERRAPAGVRGRPVIACIPRELGGWWTGADGTCAPAPDDQLSSCDNPRCGEPMWLNRRGQLLIGMVCGHGVRLCMPCAVVEYAAQRGCRVVGLGDVTSP